METMETMETTFATFALGIACSNYVGRQRMVKEAENMVITTRKGAQGCP